MNERPIPFSQPMVRAILDGRKTMTRRVVKPQPDASIEEMLSYHHPKDDVAYCVWGWSNGAIVENSDRVCPYGKVGDRLWVQEKHCFMDVVKSALSQFPLGPENNNELGPDVWNLEVEYSDGTECSFSREGEKPKQTRRRGDTGWRRDSHMPRWASRLTLEITSVRIERLQDIGDDDAKAEGADRYLLPVHPDREKMRHAIGFQQLWESINGRGSWAANPWVWVVEFMRVTR